MHRPEAAPAMTYRLVLGRRPHPAGAAILAQRPDLEIVELHDPSREALKAALADADGLMAWLERVDRDVLAAAPRLRVVSRLGVGFDTIDIPACSERGIAVKVVNGANDLSVAEHAMMLMLGVARRSLDAHLHVRDGGWWPKEGPRMVDLAGRTALVVGYGRIGTRVAAYCRGFRMRVLVHDPLYHPARIAADGHEPARPEGGAGRGGCGDPALPADAGDAPPDGRGRLSPAHGGGEQARRD